MLTEASDGNLLFSFQVWWCQFIRLTVNTLLTPTVNWTHILRACLRPLGGYSRRYVHNVRWFIKCPKDETQFIIESGEHRDMPHDTKGWLLVKLFCFYSLFCMLFMYIMCVCIIIIIITIITLLFVLLFYYHDKNLNLIYFLTNAANYGCALLQLKNTLAPAWGSQKAPESITTSVRVNACAKPFTVARSLLSAGCRLARR